MVDGDNFSYVTNRQFRDVNGWYHIVAAVDTTDSTAGDRVKLYINGERQTSFASSMLTHHKMMLTMLLIIHGATINIGNIIMTTVMVMKVSYHIFTL